MNQSIRNLWIALFLVLVIGFVGWFTPIVRYVAGALPLSRLGYNAVADQGFTVGTTTNGTTFTGDRYNKDNWGTCYIMPTATTIAASTTQLVDCQSTAAVNLPNATETPLSGILPTDTILSAMLSTSSATVSGTAKVTFGNITVDAATASSTAGIIVLLVNNGTGGTYTWPTVPVGGVNASGTVQYFTRNNN